MSLRLRTPRPLAAVVVAAALATIPGWAPAAVASPAGPAAKASTVATSHATGSAVRPAPAHRAHPADTPSAQTAPLLPYTLPTTSITTAGQTYPKAGQLLLQASGPCDSMIDVLAHANLINQWNEPHTLGKYTSYDGSPWAQPGYGCGAEAFLNGTEGPDFDLMAQQYPLWYLPCSTIGAGTTSAPGAECLGAAPNPADPDHPAMEYGVPSPTLRIPVSCLLNYDASSGYFPMPGNAANDPDANNSSPGLEGNTLHCSVQAQQYVPGLNGNPGSWQPLGSPLSLTSAISSCSSPGTCPNQNVNSQRDLTIALPYQYAVQGTEVRLSYSAYIGQNGSLDGSGVSDDPIGTTYCKQAREDAAVDKSLGLPIPPNYNACVTTKTTTATVGDAVGTTPAALFKVEPTALAQLAVLPYKLIYQPPGDGSTASFSVTDSTLNSTKVSLAKSVADNTAEDESTTTGGSAGGGLGGFFTANISYSHTWETNVANTETQAASTANEVDITDQNATTWTIKANPALDDPNNPPWKYDVISLMVHPQFAMWDLATCSSGVPSVPAGSHTPVCPNGSTIIGGTGEEPIGAQNATEASFPIGQLVQAAQAGKSLTLPSIYDVTNTATGKLVPVVLSTQDLWSLISLDPFAATALGLEAPPPSTQTVPSGPGQAVDPAPLLASPGQSYDTEPFLTEGQGGPGSGGSFSIGNSVTTTTVQSAMTDTSSTYESQVTDISANKESIETGIHIPITGLFSVSGSASVSYSTTTTSGVDAKVTYDSTDTQASTIATATSDTFNDSQNGIYTNVWLDPRWGTFAFQVIQPTVTGITPAQGWPTANARVTVNGSGFWSGPAEVLFCPQVGACKQGTIEPGYSDVQMTVAPPSMPAGTVADVRVITDGGKTDTSSADLYTYGNPGKATITTSAPASGAPGTLERIVATGFRAGETVTVSFPNGSIPVAKPVASSNGSIDDAFVLPAMTPGSYQVEVAGQSSGNLATKMITIKPSLTLHPASGEAGQTIVATLLGFGSGQAASLHWGAANGTLLAQGTTDSRGSLTTTFVVPAGLGRHNIYAVSGTTQVPAVFTTTSTPTGSALGPGLLSPPTGAPGTQILVHAAPGTFTGGDVVAVTGLSDQYETTAASDGSLLSTLVIGSAATANYQVTVVGMQGGTTTAALTVAPGLHLLPSSAAPGQAVIAAVQGFPSAGPVTLHWASPTGTPLTAAPTTVDSFGSADIAFTVPATATAGQVRVYAVGPAGTQASAIMTVT
jgi:hypothetical protein